MAGKQEVKVHQLHVPQREEVASLFQQKLGRYFDSVSASVVHCPDLTAAPFHLAQSGLGGHEAICDVSSDFTNNQITL